MANRGRSSGRRADYQWVGSAFDMGSVTTGSISAVAVINQAATLTRCRGSLVTNITSVATVGLVRVDVGLILATDNQVAVGITAFSDPTSDFDAEWTWMGQMYVVGRDTTTANNTGGISRDILQVDTKAMRKVKQNEQLVLVAVATSLTGSIGVEVGGTLRTLFAS